MQLAFSISWVSVIKPLSDNTEDVDGMNMSILSSYRISTYYLDRKHILMPGVKGA